MTNPQILLIIFHLATSNLEFEPRSRQLSPFPEFKIKLVDVCPAWSLSHYSLPCFPGYLLSFSMPSNFDDRLPSFALTPHQIATRMQDGTGRDRQNATGFQSAKLIWCLGHRVPDHRASRDLRAPTLMHGLRRCLLPREPNSRCMVLFCYR